MEPDTPFKAHPHPTILQDLLFLMGKLVSDKSGTALVASGECNAVVRKGGALTLAIDLITRIAPRTQAQDGLTLEL